MNGLHPDILQDCIMRTKECGIKSIGNKRREPLYKGDETKTFQATFIYTLVERHVFSNF
jgi:hypothetical protein